VVSGRLCGGGIAEASYLLVTLFLSGFRVAALCALRWLRLAGGVCYINVFKPQKQPNATHVNLITLPKKTSRRNLRIG